MNRVEVEEGAVDKTMQVLTLHTCPLRWGGKGCRSGGKHARLIVGIAFPVMQTELRGDIPGVVKKNATIKDEEGR